LAQRDEISESRFIDPAAAEHKVIAEIAEMRDWATERGHAEL
jgi:hypothetical protein